MKTTNEIEALLGSLVHYILTDTTFGDSEHEWRDDKNQLVASGYRGIHSEYIVLYSTSEQPLANQRLSEKNTTQHEFRFLFACGKKTVSETN